MLDAAHFREKAVDCRARARTAGDPVIHRELLFLADHYEQLAADIDKLIRAPLPSWAS